MASAAAAAASPQVDFIFWRDIAAGLGHWTAMPHPDGVNDVLGQWFDGTNAGLNFVFGHIARGQAAAWKKEEPLTTLSVEQFLQALIHFGFFHKKAQDRDACLAEPSFQRLLKTLKGESRGGATKTSNEAFEALPLDVCKSAIRRLRVGALFSWKELRQADIHSYEYDGETISGGGYDEDATPSLTQRMHRLQFFKTHKALAVDRVRENLVGTATADEAADARDGVKPNRWIHAHRPSLPLLLALGQRYQMAPSLGNALCRLNFEKANCEVREKEDKSDLDGYHWNKAILPAIFLDENSRRSLDKYSSWLQEGKKTEPPMIVVGVVHLNLAVLWSTGGWEGKRTVITIASESKYLGSWCSDKAPYSVMTRLYEWISCPCFRSGRADGYKPLSQEETHDYDAEKAADDDETEMLLDQDRLDELLTAHMRDESDMLSVMADADPNTRFEVFFSHVLRLLGDRHSRLRLGSHIQLVCRIVLSRSMGYLEVLELYKAVIARFKDQLNGSGKNKDTVIAKVAKTKYELEEFHSLIGPVENLVSSITRATDNSNDEEDVTGRITRHQLAEIENIMRQVLHEAKAHVARCQSLIDDYDRQAQDRVANIMNVLTFITFVVMPMQILTGLYGMNFKRMPELNWDYGYHYFWALSIAGTILFSFFLGCIYRVAT